MYAVSPVIDTESRFSRLPTDHQNHISLKMNEENERNHGPQRIDDIMQRWGLDNHDLVTSSIEQLTHKQVQKARQGRQLTLKMMQKVARTLNICIWNGLHDEEKEAYYEYIHRDLFTYAKGYDPAWNDPNEAILKARAEKK